MKNIFNIMFLSYEFYGFLKHDLNIYYISKPSFIYHIYVFS